MNPSMLDHIGFNVGDFPAAKAFFTAAHDLRDDHPHYYGAFVIGPDGHDVEAGGG